MSKVVYSEPTRKMRFVMLGKNKTLPSIIIWDPQIEDQDGNPLDEEKPKDEEPCPCE